MNIQLQLTVVTLHIHLVFIAVVHCSLVLVMGEVIRRWRGDGGGYDMIFYGSADN